MLEELSKNHKHWLSIAYQICKDKDYANDLVQDMYLKLYNCDKDINEWYIYRVIKNMYLNTLKSNKENYTLDFDVPISEFDIEPMDDVEIMNSIFETSPTYRKIIIESIAEDGIMNFCRQSKISYPMVKRNQEFLKTEICQRKKNLGLM